MSIRAFHAINIKEPVTSDSVHGIATHGVPRHAVETHQQPADYLGCPLR